MKKFSFNLDSVRGLRADAEQRAQEELGRTLAAAAAAHEARALRERTLARAQEQLSRREAAAHELVQADRDREAAQMRLGYAAVESQQAEGQVDVARTQLLVASQALEVLQKLEERRREAHRASALKDEEAIVAEITEARAARARAMARKGIA